jgi:hypothetical protein
MPYALANGRSAEEPPGGQDGDELGGQPEQFRRAAGGEQFQRLMRDSSLGGQPAWIDLPD